MARFGDKSKEVLQTLHPVLRFILQQAIKHRDFTLIEGHRSKERQNELFRTGKSKVKHPNSKHNSLPSMAVDLAPWFESKPYIRWNEVTAFASLTGFIMGVAAANGVTLRSGGDWDGDGDHSDQTFMDWPHLELKDWPEELEKKLNETEAALNG